MTIGTAALSTFALLAIAGAFTALICILVELLLDHPVILGIIMFLLFWISGTFIMYVRGQ